LAASRKSPRDHTGRKAIELAEKHAEEIAKNQGRITTVAVPDIVVEDVVEDDAPIEVGSDMVKLRVNTDLEDVTIGQGNTFTFYRNKIYTVPKWVYDHLDEKGYVWH